jgi:hypothetical protein
VLYSTNNSTYIKILTGFLLNLALITQIIENFPKILEPIEKELNSLGSAPQDLSLSYECILYEIKD